MTETRKPEGAGDEDSDTRTEDEFENGTLWKVADKVGGYSPNADNSKRGWFGRHRRGLVYGALVAGILLSGGTCVYRNAVNYAFPMKDADAISTISLNKRPEIVTRFRNDRWNKNTGSYELRQVWAEAQLDQEGKLEYNMRVKVVPKFWKALYNSMVDRLKMYMFAQSGNDKERLNLVGLNDITFNASNVLPEDISELGKRMKGKEYQQALKQLKE